MERIKDSLTKDLSLPLGDRDLYLILNHLSILLGAGLSINKALSVMESQGGKKKRVALLGRLRQNVERGYSFSQALGQESFPSAKLLAHMAKGGEASGSLDKVMTTMAAYYKRKTDNKRLVLGSILYPLILLITSIVLVFFILTYVMPTFIDLFTSSQIDLPSITKMLLGLTDFLSTYGSMVIGGLILIGLGIFFLYKRNKSFRLTWDRTIAKGALTRKYILFQHLSTSSFLYSIMDQTGLPILEIMTIIKEGHTNTYLKDIYQGIIHDLARGLSLHEAMANTDYFPHLYLAMVETGQEAGSLGQVMNKMASYYQEELTFYLKRMISFLEPLMILIMAILVGFLVLSIALPMFDLVNYGL